MANFFKSLFSGSAEESPEAKAQKDFDVLKYDGIKALKIGKNGYAVRCFTEALKLQEDAEVLEHLVTAYTREDRTEEAVEAAGRDQTRLERTAAIKGYTLEQLKKAVPRVEVISAGDAPHICAISLPGYKSEVVVRVLGDRGICVSSGSACHRGKPSHVFAAMGLPKPWLDGAVRLSFSPESTRAEADALVSALKDAADTLFTTLS